METDDLETRHVSIHDGDTAVSPFGWRHGEMSLSNVRSSMSPSTGWRHFSMSPSTGWRHGGVSILDGGGSVCPAPTGRKRRGGSGGVNKLCAVSPELQTIVGQPTLPRIEIVKQLWAYIRKNNLQDPNNKRKIICNEELRLVFETDCTDIFKMNKLLAKHIIPLEPTKQTVQNSKKPKVDVEYRSQNDDPVPIVTISEALANFFGIDEREMS
ncbi:unnamed protein product [Fraxinus pennsylvanica]|uniref:DM2 domain-containing protein n=1 Tax=Fraxinus pennsylvanica TaxID=56036 RepID=A0AAD2DNY3_9LAMI|nr:unnamed protein product [Fraxinus pennsylvanica]